MGTQKRLFFFFLNKKYGDAQKKNSNDRRSALLAHEKKWAHRKKTMSRTYGAQKQLLRNIHRCGRA